MKIQKSNKLLSIIKSHLKTIKGEDGDVHISEDELKFRRESCDTCTKNSKNISKDKLGVFGNSRNIIHKEFCTACSCPIEEKTKTPTEECGLVYLGEKPLWHRVLVETRGDTPNLINNSPRDINISNNISEYLVYVDYIEKDTKFTLTFDTKDKDSIINVDYRLSLSKEQGNKHLLEVVEIGAQENYIYVTIKIPYVDLPSGSHQRRLVINYEDYTHTVKSIPTLINFRKR